MNFEVNIIIQLLDPEDDDLWWLQNAEKLKE